MSGPVTDEIHAWCHDIGPQPLARTLSPPERQSCSPGVKKSVAMWHRIRTAVLSPQAIVVLALLFLVTDALLSIFSPASAAMH